MRLLRPSRRSGLLLGELTVHAAPAMVKSLIAALVLGVGGAPAVVAWCLTLCSPAPAAAAGAGHCGLHATDGAGVQVTTRGMEGCATDHDAGYGLVDSKSPDGAVRLLPPALAAVSIDLPRPTVAAAAFPPPARHAPMRAPTHLTPLRL